MDTDIKVSVAVLCYNHERYIRQALDSILSQRVNFNYEILVCDDCSSDSSRSIILEYKLKYPKIIKVCFQKRNRGATRSGYMLGKKSRGEYLITLEGDDYWCDAFKLQKQADFLDSHPEYCACAHRCNVVDEYGNPREMNEEKCFWFFDKTEYGLEDFKEGRYSGHINTVMYRNVFLDDSVDTSLLYKAHRMIGDRTMQMILAVQGKTYVMQEKMSCYRFVEKKDEDNWESLARKKNLRYDEFAYICFLERYAKEKWNMDISLKKVKREKLVCAAIVLLNDKNKENLKVVMKIINISGCRAELTCLAIRAMLQKTYYRRVLKQDKPIEV